MGLYSLVSSTNTTPLVAGAANANNNAVGLDQGLPWLNRLQI
eukprot:SAG11_NODE_41258_length_196_cov_27.041237_1_plen_41_part_01